MPGSIRIGKIAGIEISIHVSWLIIVVLLTWSAFDGMVPRPLPGLVDSHLLARQSARHLAAVRLGASA
jgi:hypothetical protein